MSNLKNIGSSNANNTVQGPSLCEGPHLTYDYKSMRFLVRQEGAWSDVEVRL